VIWRALGWLFLAAAAAVAVRDGLTWWTDGTFHLMGLGELWSRLDVTSLSSVQAAVQRDVSAVLWAWVLRPLLAVPAVVAFLVVGLALLWLGRRGGGAEPHVLTGSRVRPRRRRSRDALS
jgi:hypothetical protein